MIAAWEEGWVSRHACARLASALFCRIPNYAATMATARAPAPLCADPCALSFSKRSISGRSSCRSGVLLPPRSLGISGLGPSPLRLRLRLRLCKMVHRVATAMAAAGTPDVLKVSLDLAEPKVHSSVALVTTQGSHTYGQLFRSASALAADLVAAGGKDGARVGVMAKPGFEFVAGLWGAWMAGAVAVPLALSYPEAELAHVLSDADVSVVLAPREFESLLRPIAEKRYARLLLWDLALDGGSVMASGLAPGLPQVAGEKPALIIYTSGTTGRPKGVVHTHAGLAWQAKVLAQQWEYSAQDRMLHCLPLHHVHGLINALLAPLYVGAAVEMLPKFSTSGVWRRLRESYPVQGQDPAAGAVTMFTGVPTIYVRLLQGYDAMDDETRAASVHAASRLRLMMCGSSALPQPVMVRWRQLTGHTLLERYGMTEFGMALSNPVRGERRAGYVGTPLPGVEMRVLEEGDELCVKSLSMFQSYWRQPTVTAESFTEDGFFRTGDSVSVDEDGYVKILGRTSVDIIKSGGYKLSALEIEAKLLEHPSVRECAVVGLPDKDYGESICAVLVADVPITLQELAKWAAARMAHYKIPNQLRQWEQLPRNAMGKVNKKELSRVLQQQQQQQQQVPGA